jgi:hypothetical protein
MGRSGNRTIALGTLKGAVANIGVQETGDNAGKAVETYLASCKPPLGPGAPWCAAFVRFRMKDAATKAGIVYDSTFPRSAWTPDWHKWGVENNKFLNVQKAQANVMQILPGDLALFYFRTLGRIGHIGIVETVQNWGVTTIEGNTSPEPEDEDSVQRDGDGVYRKQRTWSELGKFGGILMVDF